MKKSCHGLAPLACIALCIPAESTGASANQDLTIPQVHSTTQRDVTIEDMLALRIPDSLSIAPDGRHFAVFIRQADADANAYRTAWFIGNLDTGELLRIAGGGELGLASMSTGFQGGDLEVRQSRWSPDGRFVAYLKRENRELQLWTSAVDGSRDFQLTHGAADVVDFEWRSDGRRLYFRTGPSRADLADREQKKVRDGYQYDEDLTSFFDFMKVQIPNPAPRELTVWSVDTDGTSERAALDEERADFDRLLRIDGAGATNFSENHVETGAETLSSNGSIAWIEPSTENARTSRIFSSQTSDRAKPIACESPHCQTVVNRIWWDDEGKELVFLNGEGLDYGDKGLYAWNTRNGRVREIVRLPDDVLYDCDHAVAGRIVCLRETSRTPPHIAAIDIRSGAVKIIATLNPEFRNIRVGKVERIEWSMPRLAWNLPGGALQGLYPDHAFGYVLYPFNFDPKKKYPIFIDPYTPRGFGRAFGDEQPLNVYTANGIIVLRAAFPWPIDPTVTMRQLYSAELEFPHLSMLAASTLAGLDKLEARGFIDPTRVGIGGVSHGTFVPLYILQKYDRISAISVSGGGFSPEEYYWPTRRGRQEWSDITQETHWPPSPDGAGHRYWDQIDVAEHIDEIEAPILMHNAAYETYPVVRFIRRLADAGKPYDAYIFPRETHQKWQPAHLRAIQERNLDWFRFWLQDYQDPSLAKSEQNARWRRLRELQCKNPRSIRNFCEG